MPMSALFSTWKLSAMVLAYSQAIPSNAVVLPISPHLVQNTVHSTDPRITFAPESSCTGILGGCGKRYDPWDLETYTDRDGVRHSYYRTSSWGNHPESTDQRRGISFGFRGTGLQVYGAPYRQLQELGHVPGKQELCLLGGCQDIDAKAIYDATSEAERDSPVLLWSYDGLPDNSYHRLELRLLDTSQGREQTRAMTVHHIIYTSRSLELLPGYQPSDQELIVNTTYYDTNSWVSFSSGRRPRYDPWRKEVVALSSGDQQTFHHTSSWDHDPYGENARTIFFKFQGVALYVYGASSAQLALIANDNYEHAHQEICIDSECEAIDTHQIYLNIEASRAHEPVLLWSHEGYPSAVLRHVQIRLLDKHSPVGHIRRMTLSRFVVNEVKGHSPWTHPIANAKYSNVTISASSRFVRYSPRRDYVNGDRKYPYSPWDAQRYTAPGGELQTYFRTSTWDHDPTSRIRAWRFSFIGHEIRVYGAPREYLVHPAHAKQEACLDGECHPVDIERAYMRVEPDAEREPVLLWSMKDIDVSRLHTLTMQMIESGEEAGSEVKGMTLERLEYIKVEPSIDTFRSSWWWIWILPIVPAIGGILYCIRSRSSGAGSNIRILSTPQQSYDSTGVLCRQSTPVTSPGSPGIREKSYPYTTLAHPTQFNAPPAVARGSHPSSGSPHEPPPQNSTSHSPAQHHTSSGLPHMEDTIPPEYSSMQPTSGPIASEWTQTPQEQRQVRAQGDVPQSTSETTTLKTTQMELTPSAAGTETTLPIPPPPPNEVRNPVANATIQAHPHLFAIVTPIKADRFERLLSTHPNRPLVESMIKGLREGFWPYAITEGRNVPDTVIYPNHRLTGEEMAFVREQRDQEIALGRYSSSFGPNLLPGMQTSPIGVVPKPRSNKLRMIVDQSAGEFALNSYVSRSDAGIRLDNLSDLRKLLVDFYRVHGRGPRWIFKTDVSQAYRRLPAHPLWQIKQVMSIDGQNHVNRCIDFGGRGSGKLWCLFFGLVVWAAIKVRGIEGLCHYVDDAFGFDDTEELVYYAKYDAKYPAKQVKFLQLLDDIGCPHDKPKQLFFRAGTVLGFHVDPQSMTLSLPEDSREDLIKSLRDFTSGNRSHTLREWLKILGRCNWALRVHPLLGLALQSSHRTLKGKIEMSGKVVVNGQVKEDLNWFADRVKESNGLRMLELLDWDESEADAAVICDA